MISLKHARKLANRWRYQGTDRPSLSQPVVDVEADTKQTRLWATDGHRAIVFPIHRCAPGVYYPKADIPTDPESLDIIHRPPNIDHVIRTQTSDPIVLKVHAGWALETFRPLTKMLKPSRSNLWIEASESKSKSEKVLIPVRSINVHMQEVWTVREEQAARKSPQIKTPGKLVLALDTGASLWTRRDFAIAINPLYLCDAIEDLGFTDSEFVCLRQAGDYEEPYRIDGPRGYALIMPIRR